jgi:hypothetical protein
LEELAASIFRLKVEMEMVWCPETLVSIYTRHSHNPEDHYHLNLRSCTQWLDNIVACGELLLGYGTVNNLSAYAAEEPVTSEVTSCNIEDVREAVLQRNPAPGGQCCCNGTCDNMSPTSTEE